MRLQSPIWIVFAVFAAVLLLARGERVAGAHAGGIPAVAWPSTPKGVGEVADTSFSLLWFDGDVPVLTGTATIDWFYTNARPPTFSLGVVPPELEGIPLVSGIPEHDRENRYEWDTSSVAPGSYWIWSAVNEPPAEQTPVRIIAFSRGVVTIAHAGDDVRPAILVAEPSSAYRFVDQTFDIVYEAFDPDRTGRVRIEAIQSYVDAPPVVVAEDLPAASTGTVTWDTRNIPDGDWSIRVTLEDARGYSFTAYSRFFLLVGHTRFDAGAFDGGLRGGGDASDAGGIAGDATDAKRDGTGCGCKAVHR